MTGHSCLRLLLLACFAMFAALPAMADQGKDLFDSGKYSDAVAWWKQASKTSQDHEAEFRLGDYYESGLAEPENLTEAAKWYILAAEGGHAGAQFAIGAFYEAGAGVEQSRDKAAFWYEKCASRNIANCQFNLGRLYSSGDFGAPDLVEAYKWYYLSAKNGFLDFDAEELVQLAGRMSSEQKRESVQRAMSFTPAK
jgi:uncharacterized protein